jgi:hypothetical protein
VEIKWSVGDGISRSGQAPDSANTGGIRGIWQRGQGAKDQVKWLRYFHTVPKETLINYRQRRRSINDGDQ